MTSDLEKKARAFASEIQELLNGTICGNVRIKAVSRITRDHGPIFTLGSGLSRSNLPQPEGFPVGIDAKKPRMWMNLSYQVRMDDEQRHLMVHSSYCAVFSDAALEECLCHFDYERDKPDGYPEAHLQVHGQSHALDALNRGADSGRPLEKLHFPVGGRRLRPCLEDMIEFLVVERLTDAREGHEKLLEDGRARFQRNQLKAAMRRNPEVVAEFLREQESSPTRQH